MAEIFYSEKRGEYTLNEEVDGEKTLKKVPIKFKLHDKNSRFRKQILKEELEKSR